MNPTLKLGVGGALGRMGAAVTALAADRPDIAVAARFDRADAEADGLTDRQTALALCDVVVDFSSPEASVALARAAAERGRPALVIGATGFSPAEDEAIAAAARRVAIVKSGNFSIGVNVLAALVRQAAARLGPELWDIEILEAHHRHKRDAPSGTALLLGQAAAIGRGAALPALALPPHAGLTDPRPPGGIGFASLRAGGLVGEHSVIFAAEEEVITLSHSARDRTLFARGALLAATWVRGRGPGVYGMGEVLGFGTSGDELRGKNHP